MHPLFLFLLSCLTCFASPLVESARKQVGVTVSYDPSYQNLAFPNGDVKSSTGVCTDVVIRALRDAYKFDLQSLVNADMKKNFSKYPTIWGLSRTDHNIDHRRVPNLMKFFERKGYSIGVKDKKKEGFQPGDIVTCAVPPHLPHIMIVSDKKNAKGIPYIIHNIGGGTQEQDRLFDFKITGHYRYKAN